MNFKKMKVLSREVSIYEMEQYAVLSKEEDHRNFLWSLSSYKLRAVRRPFLNVYPAMEKALARSKLNIELKLIPENIIHELGAIEIRFSESSKRHPFSLVFANLIDNPRITLNESGSFRDETDCVLLFRQREESNSLGLVSSSYVILPLGDVVSDICNPSSTDSEMMDWVSISIGVLLLACQQEYFEPILLNRDKNRDLTGGNLDAAISRARRNGNFGFDVGKELEMSPHYRRPHFAIRWTGPGGKVPRIVPVKSSIINKSVLGEIPTGYEDE